MWSLPAALRSLGRAFGAGPRSDGLERGVDVAFAAAYLSLACASGAVVARSRRKAAMAAALGGNAAPLSSVGYGTVQQQQAAAARPTPAASRRWSSLEHLVWAFYGLLAVTAVLRALWFAIPSAALEPSYVPTVFVFAKPDELDRWPRLLLSEVLLALGSDCLYMLFLMIIVLWRYLLSMALQREQDWSNPRATLFGVGVALVSLQGLNWALWLLGWYSSRGVLLFDATMIACLSVACSVELYVVSRKLVAKFLSFRKMMVPSQRADLDKKIRLTASVAWYINALFVTRAAADGALAVALARGAFPSAAGPAADERRWLMYLVVKHGAEVVTLASLLFILGSSSQIRFDGQGGRSHRTPTREHSRSDLTSGPSRAGAAPSDDELDALLPGGTPTYKLR